MANQIRTLDFLPEIFKTNPNREFLSGTLDTVVSQPNFKRVEGFIGKKFGYSADKVNYYVSEPTAEKQNYQLQPSVVFLDPESKKPKDFISYTGMLDALKVEGLQSKNQSALFTNEYYSWDPFIDFDKISNYSQYYWLENGPAAIPIFIPIVYKSEQFIVTANADENIRIDSYTYDNPILYVLREGTYTFRTKNLGGNFYIQTEPGLNVSQEQRTVLGVNYDNATEGEIVFNVPVEEDLFQDTLYYQYTDNENSYGLIKIIDQPENALIDIDDVLGKESYMSPNGVKFTNGLKVSFASNVIQPEYRNTEYYVEGVGNSIQLIPVTVYSSVTFDTSISDYITIHRASKDQNIWSRTNRWFHSEVLAITKQQLGYVSSPTETLELVKAALRPIIEFRQNLKLFNSGNLSFGIVDYIDTALTDIFVQVENRPLSQPITIDGELLEVGDTIVFRNEYNAFTRNAIYKIYSAPVGDSGELVYKLKRITEVLENGLIHVNNGDTQKGSSWVYKNKNFIKTQQKTLVNQYPLFDVFDANGHSYGDTEYYPNTTFAGTVLFSYEVGTGNIDSELGFPVSYSSLENIGDIKFKNNYNTDTFTHIDNGVKVLNVNTGYVHEIVSLNDENLLNGWNKTFDDSFQFQVFEFVANETNSNYEFICDVPLKDSDFVASIVVYQNDNIISREQITYNVNLDQTTSVRLSTADGDRVTILIRSDKVSNSAYYDYPVNLENNSFNKPITTVSLGDIRNQYRSIFANNAKAQGDVFGFNNLHDLKDINKFGTAIIQSSSSLLLPGIFLRSSQANIFDSLQFNSDQYTAYKALILDIVNKGDYILDDSPDNILDDVLLKVSASKENAQSFIWTDMLFNGSPYASNSYLVKSDTDLLTIGLSDLWSSDFFKVASFKALGVYVKGPDGKTIQLVKDYDYVVNTDTPYLNITAHIEGNSVVTVKEYNQTYGSFCPNTPSKLGLYPKFKPELVLFNEQTNPTFFIRGHDGSLSKVYGTYDTNKPLHSTELNDIRDIALLEFETRIFNNIKVDNHIQQIYDEIVPGEFRTSDYSFEEYLNMYSVSFLNWAGVNKIDYKYQIYSSNKFRYNYNQSSNKLSSNQNPLKQGHYKGLYRWFYDTETPHKTPWEMLGLSVKPTWWDSKYGAAPYTNGNIYMWQDIADGYVWNNGEPYTNTKRVRPRLLEILPVDDKGNLLNPLETVVDFYNSLTFERDWVIGDVGPAESSYLTSSVWPYDLLRLYALLKPAKFFNLFADIDRYKINTKVNQVMYDSKTRMDPYVIEVADNTKPKHSYISFIVDYVNSLGENGSTIVKQLLENVDVRLTYNVSGFTSKNYSKFFIERATPYSRNTSFLIPDENYTVLLYNNPPKQIIQYSSVIVQKVKNGWAVWGNSKNKNFFTVSVPKLGVYANKNVGTLNLKIPVEYYSDRTNIVPYGHVFYSAKAVCEFLYAYGNYLKNAGIVFDYISDDKPINWDSTVEEYILWAQQDWIDGSIVVLNPNARSMKINNPDLVVQPLFNNHNNLVLNQNLLPIEMSNMCIHRENNELSIQILSPGDTIAYTGLKLDSIEHAIIFDNFTSFNDVIYNNSTGLRHDRLIFKGYKTNEWKGFVDTNGFILNENNVKQWEPNRKYTKGFIVKNKNKYYAAKQYLEPSQQFSNDDWLETEYDEIKASLLPNISTSAYNAQYYYDLTRVNLENDVDLLSYSLIGFRPRTYLAATDLSDTTQVNLFKTMLKSKGSVGGTNILDDIYLTRGQINYSIYENWMIKNGQFGDILNNNFIEARLDNSVLSGNPALIAFTTNNTPVQNANQTINISDIISYEKKPKSANFLPLLTAEYLSPRSIHTAGYVHLDDAKLQEFSYTDLLNNPDKVKELYRNDHIWLANHNGSWDILVAVSVNTQVVQVDNNLNGTVKVTFKDYHNLLEDDLIAINNFDSKVDGFYTVVNIIDLRTITIGLTLSLNTQRITSTGIALKLVSRRYQQPSDINDIQVKNLDWRLRRYWVDTDKDNTWAVYAAHPMYYEHSAVTNEGMFGSSVANSDKFGMLVLDNDGKLYRYFGNDEVQLVTNSGRKQGTYLATVTCSDKFVYVTSPLDKKVFVYVLNNVTNKLNKSFEIDTTANTINLTGAIAVSKNGEWLYIANSLNQEILLYKLNADQLSYTFATKIRDTGVPNESGWGHSIATSVDGVKLVVGAPNEDVLGVNNAGAAYVYTRVIEKVFLTQRTKLISINYELPENSTNIFVDGVLVAPKDILSSSVLFEDYIENGSTVVFDTSIVNRVQRFQSNRLINGGLFGNSVDTNRYGSDIVVGVPYEFTNIGNDPDVEGAVYRYTNSGQRYGMVVLENPTIRRSDEISIDGFIVRFTNDSTVTNLLTLDEVVQQINTKTPTNIVAEHINNSIVIKTMDRTVDVAYNVLDILVKQYSTNSNFSYKPYAETQIIYNHNRSNYARFGYTVKMNERDSLLVAAITENRRNQTTFDYVTDCERKETIFDNDTTVFIDEVRDHGTVFQYEYAPSAIETIDNPGKYLFGQYISHNISKAVNSPKFGISLAYTNNQILVGAKKINTQNQGGVVKYTVNAAIDICANNTTGTTVFVDKKPLPIVDIRSIDTVSLYDYNTLKDIETLDFIDPARGKLLKAIDINLDYISIADPATYGDKGFYWIDNYVGKTWLDLSTIKLLNYNQPDITYNAKNWGKIFPGSTVDVYTWVESIVPPVDYEGSGFPVNFEFYNTATVVDVSTNILVTKYYFWVKNYNLIPEGKTLSPLIVSDYLLNPSESGIRYMAPLSTNVVALYNSNNLFQIHDVALHIGYGIVDSEGRKHVSWDLVKENNPEEFIPGVPRNIQITDKPYGIYLKLLDSFRGVDDFNNQVPDTTLPELLRYGTSFTPRQSLFVDRVQALSTYISYANAVIESTPIVETRFLSILSNATGNIGKYWFYKNWWAKGFTNSTKPLTTVNTYNDLLRLIAEQKQLFNGMIVKVKSNIYGNAEYYTLSYDGQNIESAYWERVGAENSTIEFSSTLWTDSNNSNEIYWIIRWLNEVCYKDELLDHRNESLMLVFNYIKTEETLRNNSDHWLTKTSFIDIKHTLRSLQPYKRYKRDNYDLVQGFVNEAKPYHVVIKDFSFAFDGSDSYDTTATDFDLPSKLNLTDFVYSTPKMDYGVRNEPGYYQYTDSVWNDLSYVDWYQNYGLSIKPNSLRIVEPGRNFSAAPRIVVKSDFTNYPLPREQIIIDPIIQNGQIQNLSVKNYGKGYTTSFDLSVIEQGITNTFLNTGITNIYQVQNPNTITLADENLFISGDYVRLTTQGQGVIASGLANDYYYIGVIPKLFNNNDSYGFTNNTIALYTSKSDAIRATNQSYAEIYHYYLQTGNEEMANVVLSIVPDADAVTVIKTYNIDDNRVKIFNAGTVQSYLLELTGRVMFDYSSYPIRTILTKIKFDRLSFRSKITQWSSGKEYFAYWKPGKQYQEDDLAIHEGFLYRCETSNNDTVFTGSKWQRIIRGNDNDTFFRYTASLALIAGLLYRCIDSNFDGQFDPEKWERVYPNDPELTAVDRIKAYYKPTDDMPGAVEEMLMDGVEYPNSTYKGEVFSLGWDGTFWDDNDGWDAVLHDPVNDTILKSPPFPIENKHGISSVTGTFDVIDNSSYKIETGWYVKGNGLVGYKRIDTVVKTEDNNWIITVDGSDGSKFVVGNKYEITEQPSYYDVVGGYFPDGYGPEELLAGVLADKVNIDVNTYQTWEEQVKLTASNKGLDNNFGQFVKQVSEDMFIVSAPRAKLAEIERGSVYVYKFNTVSKEWEEKQILVPTGVIVPNESFGACLAANKKNIVVGTGIGVNKLFIFKYENGEWVLEQLLNTGTTTSQIALDDTTVYVGSSSADTQRGCVYVYKKQGNTWTQVQKVVSSDRAIGDQFGIGLDVSGNFMVVGAPGDDDLGASSGSAYVFTNDNGTWVQKQKLVASNGFINDFFGYRVAINGINMAITSLFFDKIPDSPDGIGLNSGCVYMYEFRNNIWTETQRISPDLPSLNDTSGWDISLSDTNLAIATVGDDKTVGSMENSGAVHLYTYMGRKRDSNDVLTTVSGWQLEQKLYASDIGANKLFGSAVSIINNTLVVGSYGDDTSGQFTGAAYVFSNFSHRISVDRFGVQQIKSDAGEVLPNKHAFIWWYDDADTTLLDSSSESALLLKD